MNLLSTPEFKVGALVVGVGALIGFMSLKVADGPGILKGTEGYHFVVDDAGGLVKNSAVKMAGIKVGIIRNIELDGHRAKVFIELEDDVKFTQSGKVELRSDGILGDRHVELIPGNPSDPPLAGGSQIATTDGSGGLNQVMQEVGKITKSLTELADNLNRAAKGEGDDSTTVGRIILNIEKLTTDLAEITGENKEKVHDILTRIDRLTKNIDDYVGAESFSRVNQSLKNIEEITAKINNGEGTLGRLINDDQTIEEINTAVASVNEFLGGANKMETSIDFHSEYLSSSNFTKSYLGVRLQPGPDRYYEVQVIDDPQGVRSSTFTEVTDQNGVTTTEDKTVTGRDRIKLSVLFAKNFYNFTVKGGLIENSGGFGFDYYLLDRQLRLSAEFFELDDLYIRAYLRYNIFKGIYAVAGGDNLLSNGTSEFSSFIGAGLFLTNDDLKALASKVSF